MWAPLAVAAFFAKKPSLGRRKLKLITIAACQQPVLHSPKNWSPMATATTDDASSSSGKTSATDCCVSPSTALKQCILQDCNNKSYLPYDLPEGAIIRLHKTIEEVWWKRLFRTCCAAWIVGVWAISTFAFFFIFVVGIQQGRQYRLWIADPTTQDPPDFIAFSRAIKKLLLLFLNGVTRMPLGLSRIVLAMDHDIAIALDRFNQQGQYFETLPNLVQDLLTVVKQAVVGDVLKHGLWDSGIVPLGQGLRELLYSASWQFQASLGYTALVVWYRLIGGDTYLEFPRIVHRSPTNVSWYNKVRLTCCNRNLTWFRPGSAVIFEDYDKFIQCGRSTRPTLVCYHPHGVLSMGLSQVAVLPEFDGYAVFTAPALKNWCPLFEKLLFINVRTQSAAKKPFLQELAKGTPSILVPGGIHEASLTASGRERLYLKMRKGFIRYAMQHGYSLTPIYGFGENFIFDTFAPDRWTQTRFRLNSANIPSVYPSLFSRAGLFPRRVPLLVVVGKTLELPHIKHPTRSEVEIWHAKYMSEIQALYKRYAESYYRFAYETYGLRSNRPPQKQQSDILVPPGKYAPPLELF